ncbi:MAG: Hydroxymethylpyrimidine ABC transporter, transmembrane component [uncultured Corynebacteriales bacterium]|uniref:Hydroxymethylpyrimidine ABC transporter, transmembrane component n=1 Tax=uncultured Mycobacteriales bacterium TaxID=581187 RepID=A0A6J4JF40_9ACTN|nr:MAG: Hydroxymethylpyrimidine ABC transporter, transmembrane component [uncultured Corynebacteriales bacterium]
MSVDTRLPEAAAGGVVGAPVVRRRRRGGRLSLWLPPLGTLLIFLGVWYYISYVRLDEDRRFLLPPPHEVLRVSFLDADNRTQIFTALWLSTWIAAVGLALAIVLGMALGIAMAQARWVERSLYPYAVILQCVPTLALVPVIGFWFDFGLTSRLIVTVWIALFPVVSSTLFGLQSAERGQHELFTLHKAGRLTRLWKLQLPAAMPAVLTGFQVAATLAVVGSVVGDFFFKQGDAGIGVLIDLYRARLQSAQLFGAALAASLLGVVAFWLFGLISRVATGGWYGSTAYDKAA